MKPRLIWVALIAVTRFILGNQVAGFTAALVAAFFRFSERTNPPLARAAHLTRHANHLGPIHLRD
ncbi:MAG: hypothetical protein R8K48_03760 [Gallionella sp.]